MTVDVGLQPAAVDQRCETCGGPPQAGCGTCARSVGDRRRGEALSLARGGVPLRRVARETGVARKSLRRALAGGTTADTISNGPLRHAVERVMQRDALSLSEISRRAEPPFAGATHVARLIGRIRTARCRRGGRLYPPRYRTEISLVDAVRVARAAGIDPIDVDGL
jgi:hypothetical protein